MPSRTQIFVITTLGLAAAALYLFQAPAPILSSDNTPIKNPYIAEPIVEPSVAATTDTSTPDVSIAESKQPDGLSEELEAPNVQGIFIEPWEVAKTTPSDAEFYRIVEHMRQDSNFLAGVMQEFQSETDPKRLKWLAFMLGDLRDKPELTALAGQMLFSGNTQSTLSALALLSRLQESDPAARDLVLQSLSASQDPSVLTASMNALARATSEVSYTQKQQILQQLSPLTTHPEAAVRRRSYDLLFRWASDSPYISQQLSMGLSDQDARVRRSTAIGFIDHPQADTHVKLALMDMLNSSQELDRNRNLAARALHKMELDQDEKSHINAVLKSIR